MATVKISDYDVEIGTVGLDDVKCRGCGQTFDYFNDKHTLNECLSRLQARIAALEAVIQVAKP